MKIFKRRAELVNLSDDIVLDVMNDDVVDNSLSLSLSLSSHDVNISNRLQSISSYQRKYFNYLSSSLSHLSTSLSSQTHDLSASQTRHLDQISAWQWTQFSELNAKMQQLCTCICAVNANIIGLSTFIARGVNVLSCPCKCKTIPARDDVWTVHIVQSEHCNLQIVDVSTDYQILDGATVKDGTSLKVVATPDDGYEVVNVYVNGIVVSNECIISIHNDICVSVVVKKTEVPEPVLTPITITYCSNYPDAEVPEPVLTPITITYDINSPPDDHDEHDTISITYNSNTESK